jgi:hypothetical protein
MDYAIGFGGGLVWTFGAFVTIYLVGWTGPLSIALAGWPVILVIDGVARLRARLAGER